MNEVGFLATLAVSAIFAVAGASKIIDWRNESTTARDFALPRWIAVPVSWLLAPSELTVAVLLLVPQTRRWAAIAAVTLAVAFTIFTAVNLLSGQQVSCRCFGQLSSTPLSTRTLARNLVLVAAASFVAIASWPGAAFTLPHATTAAAWIVAASAVAVAAMQAGLLLVLAGRNGELLLELKQNCADAHRIGQRSSVAEQQRVVRNDLPVGAPAPDFTLANLTGAMVRLSSLLDRRRPLMLVFTSSTCGPCVELLPELLDWQDRYAAEVTVAPVFSSAPVAVSPGAHPEWCLVQDHADVAAEYRSPGTPTAVVVDPAGRIASRLAVGAIEIRQLFVDTRARVHFPHLASVTEKRSP